MTVEDLALLLELGFAEPTDQPGEYKLTHAGRVLAGEQAARPDIRDTQQWREGACNAASVKQVKPQPQPRPQAMLRSVK